MGRVLFSISELTHSFGSHPLFQGLTFSVEAGEKIALIGPNGAGKSTLMKMIAGLVSPDSGQVILSRGLKVAYLPQAPRFSSDQSVREVVIGDSIETENWEQLGLAEEMMSRLGLEGKVQEQKVVELSGGWQKKVALAHAISKNPDVLLLDEPTNHLDLDTVLWLENWVAQRVGCVISISHDRAYLRKVGQRVIEIDLRNPNGFFSVNGGYDQFIQEKREWIENQESRLESLKNVMRRELEWLSRGAKARTTKQKARIDRAGEIQKDVGLLSMQTSKTSVRLSFDGVEKNPKKLIELIDVSKSYRDQNQVEKRVIQKFSLRVTPKTRIGFLGNNGVGKSTLAKLIAQEVPPDQGEIKVADRTQVFYFDQTRESLDPQITVLKTICPSGETVEYQGRKLHIRSYLDRFLFPQEQMEMKVEKLSGGEQARLLLARLMLRPANVLILDEPTNDLDLATLSVLEDALQQFEGAVVLISHDRVFMDRVCDQILHFPSFHLFQGMDQCLEWLPQWSSQWQSQATSPSRESPVEESQRKTSRKLSYNEQKELSQMESVILKKEKELLEIKEQLEDTKIASDAVRLNQITSEYAALQSEIEQLYLRWAELESIQQKN